MACTKFINNKIKIKVVEVAKSAEKEPDMKKVLVASDKPADASSIKHED